MKLRNCLLPALAITATGGAAQAQTAGIASADPARAIAASQAYNSARQQIGTQYKTYLDQIDAKNTQIIELTKQLDKNNDGQLDQAEQQAAQTSSQGKQIQTENQAIAQLQAPIVKAQRYAVEQISAQYNASQQQVISDKKIQLILSPDVFLYAPESTDVTPLIAEALNKRVPSVSVAVPPDWTPSRQTLALHEQIQQILAIAIRAQIAREQAGQAGAAPAVAGQQPSSR